MARKVGQIVGRGRRHGWCVNTTATIPKARTKVPEPDYLRRTAGRPGSPQQDARRARPRDRNLSLSKQTLNQHLDRWLEACARPRFQNYEGLLRRCVRPQLGTKTLPTVSAVDIQTIYRELLDRILSARSIRYTR